MKQTDQKINERLWNRQQNSLNIFSRALSVQQDKN